jgi:CheY-like chemotaxis protein
MGVEDGREGLQAASTNLPALILLDMMLPGMEGTAVLKKLKQDPSTAQIPVIVLTGLSQKNAEKLKDAGAAAYLEKSSIDFEQNATALVAIVQSLLGCEKAASAAGHD